jgi:hypothetical protein
LSEEDHQFGSALVVIVVARPGVRSIRMPYAR